LILRDRVPNNKIAKPHHSISTFQQTQHTSKHPQPPLNPTHPPIAPNPQKTAIPTPLAFPRTQPGYTMYAAWTPHNPSQPRDRPTHNTGKTSWQTE
jgi:hypothetical protein